MRKIKIPPYNYFLFLALGDEEFNSTCKKKGIPPIPLEGILGLVLPLEDINGVSFLLMYLEEGADEETIWHECLHAVHFMFDSMSLPMGVDNTEAQAYTQGWIAKEVYKQIRKKLLKAR